MQHIHRSVHRKSIVELIIIVTVTDQEIECCQIPGALPLHFPNHTVFLSTRGNHNPDFHGNLCLVLKKKKKALPPKYVFLNNIG